MTEARKLRVNLVYGGATAIYDGLHGEDFYKLSNDLTDGWIDKAADGMYKDVPEFQDAVKELCQAFEWKRTYRDCKSKEAQEIAKTKIKEINNKMNSL